MKLLPINEARCAGRDLKVNPTICSDRDRCLRHKQMETDRKMGLQSYAGIKVFGLPRVGRNDCHYFLAIAP